MKSVYKVLTPNMSLKHTVQKWQGQRNDYTAQSTMDPTNYIMVFYFIFKFDGTLALLLTIIIIKAFLKCKILSIETVLSACTHVHVHTHRLLHTLAY